MTYTEDLEARLEYAQGQADRYAKMAATLKGALGDATKLDQKLEALREEFPTLDREMNSPRAGAAKAKPVKFDLDGIEAILRQAGKPLHTKALAEAAGYRGLGSSGLPCTDRLGSRIKAATPGGFPARPSQRRRPRLPRRPPGRRGVDSP